MKNEKTLNAREKTLNARERTLNMREEALDTREEQNRLCLDFLRHAALGHTPDSPAWDLFYAAESYVLSAPDAGAVAAFWGPVGPGGLP